MVNKEKILVLGLGYVGLPLAIEFGKKYKTIGFDLSNEKIESFKNKCDPMGEVSSKQIEDAFNLTFTSNPEGISEADVIIIAVPTPVDDANKPDFIPLITASTNVGRFMKHGATIVYESTVYPGATEEVCIPVLEKFSNMKWGSDFNVGYSPERVNPGDKKRTLTKVVKVVSGDCQETLNFLARLYGSIIEAGIHCCRSIKVAEASKVIENTQRDLNIALMNELAIVFDKVGIDTIEVLEAAGTKWNFLPFRPGLVGGHCIGVDPYYLTYKAERLGYHPQVILAGRRINDGMAAYIAEKTIQRLITGGKCSKGDKIIVMGLTFKENCADLRNTKVVDLVKRFEEYGLDVFVHDPIASREEAKHEYDINLVLWDSLPKNAAAIVLAVSHEQYLLKTQSEITSFLVPGGLVVDVKAALNEKHINDAGYDFWRL
jgi:UDP-N-acetyl-D-galactosamine dehydrogenase